MGRISEVVAGSHVWYAVEGRRVLLRLQTDLRGRSTGDIAGGHVS